MELITENSGVRFSLTSWGQLRVIMLIPQVWSLLLDLGAHPWVLRCFSAHFPGRNGCSGECVCSLWRMLSQCQFRYWCGFALSSWRPHCLRDPNEDWSYMAVTSLLCSGFSAEVGRIPFPFLATGTTHTSFQHQYMLRAWSGVTACSTMSQPLCTRVTSAPSLSPLQLPCGVSIPAPCFECISFMGSYWGSGSLGVF